MPAFSFEKISGSKRLPPDNQPAPTVERRGIVASLLERMTRVRLLKAEHNFVRFESRVSDKDQG